MSDGLKAWEVLKARAENIDLILTEVELPSISGFALLTLIMEHDVCKNIPVISEYVLLGKPFDIPCNCIMCSYIILLVLGSDVFTRLS